MSNGEVCCILGVCCPPAQRRLKLFDAFTTELRLGADEADRVVDWVMEHVTPVTMLTALAHEHGKHE